MVICSERCRRESEEYMNDVTLDQLDRSEYSRTRLLALLSDLESTYIPPISSITDIVKYCDKLIRHAEVFVVKQSEEDFGFIAFYANDHDHHCAFVSSIGVKPEFRGHGIGLRLLNRAVEVAREKGMRRIRLEVSLQNQAALRLYRKYGFSDVYVSAEKQQKDSVVLEKKI